MVITDGSDDDVPRERGSGGEPKQGRIKITGLVDWEYSGWYPEYWEYVKALNSIGTDEHEFSDWWKFLPTASIGQCSEEWAIDCTVGMTVF